MKQKSRILGIDDAPKHRGLLIGVLYRGTEFMEQVEFIEQRPDTGDASKSIIKLAERFNQFYEAILLDGVTFCGFNIADVDRIAEETGKPVIAVTVNRPDRGSVKAGMRKAGLDPGVVDRLPDVQVHGDVYFQASGISREEAVEVIEVATLQGNVPEAVRAADLIGSAFKD